MPGLAELKLRMLVRMRFSLEYLFYLWVKVLVTYFCGYEVGRLSTAGFVNWRLRNPEL